MSIFSKETEQELATGMITLVEKRANEIANQKMHRYLNRDEVSEYSRLKGRAFDELLSHGLKPINYLKTGKLYDRFDVDKAMERMKQK